MPERETELLNQYTEFSKKNQEKLKKKDASLHAFGHEALLDVEDMDPPLSGADFERDGNEKTVDLEKKFRGSEKNRAYFKAAASVLKRYPNARIHPNRGVPLRRLYQKMMQNSTTKSARSGMVNEFMRQHQAKFKSSVKAQKEFINQAVRDLKKGKRVVADQVAQHHSDHAKIYDIALTMVSNSPKVDDLRPEFSEIFYCSKNITGKAMASTAIDEALALKGVLKDAKRYNLPPKSLIGQLADELGFASIREMEEEFGKGAQVKWLQTIRSAPEGQYSAGYHEVNSYYQKIDTAKATSAKEELGDLMDLIEFGEDNVEFANDEEEKAMMASADDIRKVLSKDSAAIRVMPFTYGKRFTYKLLYYAYLNKYNFKLPFGRTLPDSNWMYVFSYFIDPKNAMGLRMNLENFKLKVGGLPLLEKSLIFDDVFEDQLKQAFRSSLSSAGVTTFQKSLTACLMNIVKIRNVKFKQSELHDEAEDLLEEINALMKQYDVALDNSSLSENLEHRLTQARLQSNVNLAFGKNSGKDLLEAALNEFGIRYFDGLTRSSKYYQLFDTMMVQTAGLIFKYTQLWKSGDEHGKQWFAFAFVNSSTDPEGYFQTIKSLCFDDKFDGVLEFLFEGKTNVELVKGYFIAMKKIFDSPDSSELNSLLVDSNFSFDVARVEWARVTAEDILASDPALALLVKANLVQTSPAPSNVPSEENSQEGEEEENDANEGEEEEDQSFDDAVSLKTIKAFRPKALLYDMYDDTISSMLTKRGRPQSFPALTHEEVKSKSLAVWEQKVGSVKLTALRPSYTTLINSMGNRADSYLKDLFLGISFIATSQGIISATSRKLILDLATKSITSAVDYLITLMQRSHNPVVKMLLKLLLIFRSNVAK